LSSQKLYAIGSPNDQQKLQKTFSAEEDGAASSSAEAGAVESLSYEFMHFYSSKMNFLCFGHIEYCTSKFKRKKFPFHVS